MPPKLKKKPPKLEKKKSMLKISNAFMEPDLTDKEKEDFQQLFNFWDKERRGAMDPREVRAQMCKMGFQADNNTIYQLINDLDSDGSQMLECEEFTGLMCDHLKVLSEEYMSREEMAELFEFFDGLDPCDRKGRIELADLRRMAQVLGDRIGDAELEAMIKGADLSGSKGYVSLDDFYQVMTQPYPVTDDGSDADQDDDSEAPSSPLSAGSSPRNKSISGPAGRRPSTIKEGLVLNLADPQDDRKASSKLRSGSTRAKLTASSSHNWSSSGTPGSGAASSQSRRSMWKANKSRGTTVHFNS